MTALLIILAIIVLILIFPFGVTVKYEDDELYAAARVLVFDIGIIPGKDKPEKKEKPPKEKKKKAKEPEEGTEKPAKKLSFTVDELMELAAMTLDRLGRFRRKLTVNNFKLYFVSAGPDPYETATTYGYVNTLLGLLSGPASNGFNVLKSDVQTGVDFERTEPYVSFAMTVTLNLGKILGFVFSLGFGFIKIKINSLKEKSREQAAEERTDKDGTA